MEYTTKDLESCEFAASYLRHCFTPKFVWKFLDELPQMQPGGYYIAGGFIGTVLRAVNPLDFTHWKFDSGDVDIYSTDPIVLQKLLTLIHTKYNTYLVRKDDEEGYRSRYGFKIKGQAAALSLDESLFGINKELQIICIQIGEPRFVVGQFDFQHCRTWFDLSSRKLYINPLICYLNKHKILHPSLKLSEYIQTPGAEMYLRQAPLKTYWFQNPDRLYVTSKYRYQKFLDKGWILSPNFEIYHLDIMRYGDKVVEMYQFYIEKDGGLAKGRL